MNKQTVLLTPIKCGFLLSIFAISSCAGKPPTTLGHNGQLGLHPCPPSPNCVSSFAKDMQHFISPFEIKEDDNQAFNRLKALLEQNPNAHIVMATPKYLRAEFHSTFFGFVDDVEFLIQEGFIHVRSASRLGYSDFGVNRKRIDGLWLTLTSPK